MLWRSLRAEQMKLRRSPVWLAFFVLPILPAVMGTFNYMQNLGILENEWYSLWTQHTLFTCYFFLPAIIGVYCSYLFRLEHTHYNWNAAMTVPVPVTNIYIAKLLMAAVMVILTEVWIAVLFILSGWLIGLPAPIPPELVTWVLYGAMGGIVVCALQLCISMVIRSFAVPVGIALIGGVAGIAALAKGFGLWFPYSLMSLGMHANSPASEMPVSTAQFLIHSALFLVVFCVFAAFWLKSRDVVAG
jgi:ABC-2 type transport system permease protein